MAICITTGIKSDPNHTFLNRLYYTVRQACTASQETKGPGCIHHSTLRTTCPQRSLGHSAPPPTFLPNWIFCGSSTADHKPLSVACSQYHFLRAATKETLHSDQRTLSAQANILVDQAGRACLADFGLLTIISEATNLSVSSSSFTQGGTHRRMSSELFLPKDFGLSQRCSAKSSDYYALGMVIYEVLSGRVLQRNFR